MVADGGRRDADRQHTQGWQGFVMVDGRAYNWMGGAPGADLADQTSLEYTSTRTTFTFAVGGVELKAEFMSPVYPDDLRRQSVTSSYLNIAARSLDGRPHLVQVYCDVSAGPSPAGPGPAPAPAPSKINIKTCRFPRFSDQTRELHRMGLG